MKKFLKFIMIVMFILAIFSTIYFSENLKISVYNSLLICGRILIPSLFPMMFITFLLINSNLLYFIPEKVQLFFLFALTCISGYPSGSKIFSSLAENGSIKSSEAEKIIPFTVCAGPAFIINFVGNGLFASKTVGVFIYISLVVANLITFLISENRKIKINGQYFPERKNILIITTKESVESISSICSYVVIFSFMSEIIRSCFGDNLRNIFIYIVEITGAVINTKNVYFVCALLSFGGICVYMQIVSIAKEIKINFFKYLKTRIISTVVSIAILKVLFTIFPQFVITSASINDFLIKTSNDNNAYMVTLIITLLSLMISLKRSSSGKILKDIEVI